MDDLPLVGSLPDELWNDRTRRDQIVFGAGLLLAVFLLYWLYSVSSGTRELRRRENQFERSLKTYLRLEDRQQNGDGIQTVSNPLAYLGERVRKTEIDQDKVQALTPTGEDARGRSVYEIRFEGIPLRPAVQLLRDLESERAFGVREFTVARVSRDTPRFDVTLRLVRPGSS